MEERKTPSSLSVRSPRGSPHSRAPARRRHLLLPLLALRQDPRSFLAARYFQAALEAAEADAAAEAAAALGTAPAHVAAGGAAAAAPPGQVQMGAGADPQTLAEMGQMLGNIWEVARQPRHLHNE